MVNSIQAFWGEALPEQAGQAVRPTADTCCSPARSTPAAGRPTSDVGPFYCPTRDDMQVYLDTTFFEECSRASSAAQGGDFAEAYVLAHEYGHHVENLLGYLGRARTQQGPRATPSGWS